jgi:hypothetical protein
MFCYKVIKYCKKWLMHFNKEKINKKGKKKQIKILIKKLINVIKKK